MAVQKNRKYPCINRKQCVGCGCCIKACPRGAMSVPKGIYASVDLEKCVGCGLCSRACPADVIEMKNQEGGGKN